MHAADSIPEFSAIVAAYQEEGTIAEFLDRLNAVLKSLGRSYEIVCVSDGSTDGTFPAMVEFFRREPAARAAIELVSNRGQWAAITAGICEARGRHFVWIDCDLQLNPEELPLLVDVFDNDRDLVQGYRRGKRTTLGRRMLSAAGNAILNALGRVRVRDLGCTFLIIRGDIVRAFGYGPGKPLRPIPLAAEASRCAMVPVSHCPRVRGRSGWSVLRILSACRYDLLAIAAPAAECASFALGAAAIGLGAGALSGVECCRSALASPWAGSLIGLFCVAGILVLGSVAIRGLLRQDPSPAYIIRTAHRRP